MQNDLHTRAIVLRRTNYGETDRILNLLTPEGKKSVLAKGVRREKSKLAGGIELFCVSDVVIHEKTTHGVPVVAGVKEHLGILTSSKMLVFYKNLLANFESMELASNIIKHVAKVSEHVDSPDLFSLTNQSFLYLDHGVAPEVIETYFLMNIAKIAGEDINLHRDTDGEKLSVDQKYFWDIAEDALKKAENGNISADHIKLMRLMLTSPLKTVLAVKNIGELVPDILPIARAVNKI